MCFFIYASYPTQEWPCATLIITLIYQREHPMQPQLTSFLRGKSISCCLSSGTESLYPEPVYKYSSMHIMSDSHSGWSYNIHSDLDLHSKNGGFCFMRYIIYIITQSCLIKHKTKILMYMNLLQYLKRPNLFAKSSEQAKSWKWSTDVHVLI